MWHDKRNPEYLGKALAQLKELHPDKSAAERADMLEESYKTLMYAFAPNGHLSNGSAPS